MLWTKRAHQCTIFRLLGALMKVHPIPHAIFETTRSGFIQILHHCSVSWKITLLYFLAQTSYTLDKNSLSKWNFLFFEWFGENSPYFSCLVWNHNSIFLLTLHHSSMSWEISLLYIFSWNFIRTTPICKISDFRLLSWNFTKFVLW